MGEYVHKKRREVKVENWEWTLMQKIHQFYINSMHCDVKLRFQSSHVLQVHKLILCVFAEFFDGLQTHCDPLFGEIYDLEETLQPEDVIPVIEFLYTGKLVYGTEMHDKIYAAATHLRVPILINLLESQPESKNTPRMVIEPFRSVANNIVEPSTSNTVAEDSFVPSTPTTAITPVVSKVVQYFTLPSSTSSKPQLQQSVSSPATVPKRLPIWTRAPRQANCLASLPPSSDSGKIRVVLSAPVPTRCRFDDPHEDDLPLPVEDAMKYLSYDSDISLLQPLSLQDGDTSYNEGCSPAKRMRSDLIDMKEHGKQQQIRNELIAGELEDEIDDNRDAFPSPVESPVLTPTSPPKPILKKRESLETTKRVRFSEIAEEHPHPEATSTPVTKTVITQPLNPTVKPGTTPVMVSQQKVKFSLLSHPTPQTASPASGELIVSDNVAGEKRVRFSVVSGDGTDSPADPSTLQAVGNPAKIVSEMLKKYPDLVSGRRKNIKLKVLTNTGAVASGQDSNSNSKGSVSYIVVHGDNRPSSAPISEVTCREWNPENMSGPWTCTPCGDVNGRLNFGSYETFRAHITSIHGLKIDPTICEKCGFKTGKRSQLLFHMLNKHGIDPPPPFSFPKCSECEYVAFSKPLLAKHLEIHTMSLTCNICKNTFKSGTLLTTHKETDCLQQIPQTGSCDYPCPFCDLEFQMGSELKDHIEANHQVNKIEGTSHEVSQRLVDEGSLPQPVDENSQLSSEGFPINEHQLTEDPKQSSEIVALHHATTSLHLSEQSQEQVLHASEGEPGIEYLKNGENVSETYIATEDGIQESYCSEVQSNTYTTVHYGTEHQQEAEIGYGEKSNYGEECVEEYIQDAPADDVVYQTEENVNDGGMVYDGMEVVEQEVGDLGESKEEAEVGEMSVIQIDNSQKDLPSQPIEGDGEQCGGTHGDHDYAPYNSVVMFQPNVVLPQRVILAPGNMLVTHPIQVLPSTRILLSGPNLLSDQLVSYPYPQVVEGSQPQELPREVRKIEHAAFVNEWDDCSESEAVVEPVVQSGVGPSRPEFF